MIVLVNEQVIDGCGWWFGVFVECKEFIQWFFKILDMVGDLLDEIDNFDDWFVKVKLMQLNWIGWLCGL